MIQEESHEIEEENNGISPHILRCWACGKRTHFPDKCPNIHYKPSISMALRNQMNVNLRTHSKTRTSIKSKKLINAEKVALSASYALKENKKMLRIYVSRKHQQLKSLKRLY